MNAERTFSSSSTSNQFSINVRIGDFIANASASSPTCDYNVLKQRLKTIEVMQNHENNFTGLASAITSFTNAIFRAELNAAYSVIVIAVNGCQDSLKNVERKVEL